MQKYSSLRLFDHGKSVPQYSARIPTLSLVFFCLSRDFLMGCLGVCRLCLGCRVMGVGCVSGWLGVCFTCALGRCCCLNGCRQMCAHTISAKSAAASCTSRRKCVADVDRQCRFRYTTFDFAMIFDCVKVATVFRPNTDHSNDYSFFRLS